MAYSGTNTIHATFNWNPLYDSYKHVAMWGNDTTGDGTKKYPYRTVAKAASVGANIVIGSMTIRETIALSYKTIQSDGNVVIDISNAPFTSNGNGASYTFNELVIRGGTSSPLNISNAEFSNTVFNKCSVSDVTAIKFYSSSASYTNFIRLVTKLESPFTSSYCTFYQCTILYTGLLIDRCILHTCNLDITTNSVIKYSNFYNCSIKFNSTGSYVIYTTTAAFTAAYITAGGSGANLIGVYFLDPLFNNPAIGDLTLAFNSPAKNLSYFGDIIGATSIGVSLVASATAATSAFDNSSFVNLTCNATTGALTMSDTSINSIGTTKPIANLQGRNIANLSTFGFFSDRNGEYIDATPDVDYTGTYAAGDTLTTDRIYIVDGSGGSVNYNGTAYAVGDRFTCRSAASTFSNVSVASYVREIIEAPTRNNVEARFSNGNGVFKNNGDTLTSGSWYFLSVGTATYASVSYTVGQFIKGDGSAIASSGATIEEVFTSSQGYQYYETVGSLNCNRVGNVFTGAITYGNGDPAFDRTTANVFKISSKFIQLRYTIQANNLIP